MMDDGQGTQSGQDEDPLKPRDTTARSLGTPAFAWDGTGENLTVNIDVNLPDEPYGAGSNDSVVYQVWGTMQNSATVPNGVAWGTTSNRIEDQTTGVATPSRNARPTPAEVYAAASVMDYYAVQVTVRKDGTTTQDDQTIKVYDVPAAPA